MLYGWSMVHLSLLIYNIIQWLDLCAMQHYFLLSLCPMRSLHYATCFLLILCYTWPMCDVTLFISELVSCMIFARCSVIFMNLCPMCYLYQWQPDFQPFDLFVMQCYFSEFVSCAISVWWNIVSLNLCPGQSLRDATLFLLKRIIRTIDINDNQTFNRKLLKGERNHNK